MVWGRGEVVVRREVWHGRPWARRRSSTWSHDDPELLASYLPEGAPFGFPADGGRPRTAASLARPRRLAGTRCADAAAPRRALRGLALLGRSRARLRGLVRQPAGALPADDASATTPRISSSTCGYLHEGVVDVQGRRAARATGARRPFHERRGRRDQSDRCRDRGDDRFSPDLVGQGLVDLEPDPGWPTPSLPDRWELAETLE